MKVFETNGDVIFSSSGVKFHSFVEFGIGSQRGVSDLSVSYPGSLFASVSQVGDGIGISSKGNNSRKDCADLLCGSLYSGSVSVPDGGFKVVGVEELVEGKELSDGVLVEEDRLVKKKKRKGMRFRIKVGNASLRRLISGAIAGAVSRTAVAPLETIRTHLMVGSCGHSTMDVFKDIMKNDGWKGLFSGNFVNVIRVAPSKAIELFAYETVKKHLTPRDGERPLLPIPAASVAGAVAGFTGTLCTYPLELLKTRLTVQRGVYKNLVDAFLTIIREEGPAELYRGLTPSLIGVIPYAAANYYAYDTLRKAYKKAFKKEEIGNITTLLIGSAAGAISSSATFPLEVARKHMQAGALNGRQYHNMLHALVSILEKEGLEGLFRGLGPSCLKLVPAAGISFMCYEACKKILVEDEEEDP